MVRSAHPSPRIRAASVAIVVVAALLAGCSDAGQPVPGATGSAPGDDVASTSVPQVLPALSDTEARALLAQFDLTAAADLDALAALRSDPSLVAAARTVLEDGATASEQWAAAFVWVNEGDDPVPLLALVAADEAEVRLMAAIGLLARGRSEGFQPLFDLLVDDSETSAAPAVPVWQRAAAALARYTAIGELGPQLDADLAGRQAARAAWQAWFDDHGAQLAFDSGEGLWRVA